MSMFCIGRVKEEGPVCQTDRQIKQTVALLGPKLKLFAVTHYIILGPMPM